MRTRRSWIAAAVGLLAPLAHARPPRLGAHPADSIPLDQSPLLKHLADALPEGGPQTPAQLLLGEAWDFTKAPDPTALFAADAAAPAGPLPGGIPLRVLTYNTGLLERDYLVGSVAMPHVAARAAALPELLLTDNWDVLLLQEVWELDQVARFAEAAERHGYAMWAGTERRHPQHGLLILVRKALIADDGEKTEVQFQAQRRLERFPGPNIRRGYLTWTFTHAPTGQRVRVATAHTQAFPGFWRVRTLQARELGIDLGATPEATTVILGLDLNAGPYYPEDRFGVTDGKPVEGWWRNTITWPLLRLYGDLIDTAGVRAPAQDVAAMAALPPWSDRYLTEPLAGGCAQIPPGVFSATDCNPLYAANYIGEEYPARLDYLFLRARPSAARVVESAHQYTQDETFASGQHPPSDHYGVGLTLELAPAPR